MSDIDTQSQNIEEVTKTIQRQRDVLFQGGRKDVLSVMVECRTNLLWINGDILDGLILTWSLNLKLCFHSTPITRILSITVNPNPRKFQVKVYPNHRNFPVKVYPNPRIFRPKTAQNWRTPPSYHIVKYPPRGQNTLKSSFDRPQLSGYQGNNIGEHII